MHDQNRELFESVVRLLGPVLDDLVFVGGCTTGLFLTDSVAGRIRPTKDVDAIVDVTSYAEYTSLAERPEIVVEVGGTDVEVRAYIASDVRSLLDNPDFVEALPGFLLPDAASQARRGLVEKRLRAISGSGRR